MNSFLSKVTLAAIVVVLACSSCCSASDGSSHAALIGGRDQTANAPRLASNVPHGYVYKHRSLQDHDHDHDHDHDEDHDSDHSDEHNDDGDGKPWGEVIITSLLINLTSLIGVIVLALTALAPSTVTNERMRRVVDIGVPSFACGALLATAVFLIIPEAIFMLIGYYSDEEHEEHDEHDDHDDHSGHDHRLLEEDDHSGHLEETPIAWRFGVSLICGFLIPILSSMIFPHHEEGYADSAASETKEMSSDGDSHDKSEEPSNESDEAQQQPRPAEADGNGGAADKPIDWSLASVIIIGDFFHNFTDGIFVGTAFLLCDHNVAVTLSAATVYHELAQELADYGMLTARCNLSPVKALVLNFLGGLSVLFGAILMVGVGIENNIAACLLTVGAGVYIYVAGAECMGPAIRAQRNASDKLITVLAFVFGVVPIGLVLINHEHCEEGHNH